MSPHCFASDKSLQRYSESTRWQFTDVLGDRVGLSGVPSANQGSTAESTVASMGAVIQIGLKAPCAVVALSARLGRGGDVRRLGPSETADIAMQLNWLNVGDLVAEAGGDPWAINRSLQAGSPSQISSLAEAFHGAGRHSAEADHAFDQARRRFDAAWNHQNGDHPINDSAEVQRLTKSLGAQSEQLPKIGADLENIAAALADTQKQGAKHLAELEAQLEQLDHFIDLAMKDLHDHPDQKSQDELQSIIKALKADAVDDTRKALNQLHSIRNGYSDTLQKSLANLRVDGYDPDTLRSVDADTQTVGASDPRPVNAPSSIVPKPAGGAGGAPPSLKDLLLPTGKQPAGGQPTSGNDQLQPVGKQPPSGRDDQLQARSLADLLGVPVVPGAPPPQLKPADVESFKAMARQSMVRDGVPPEQIEARLNDIVGRTQQWIDNGMPNYVPPEPKPPPPPGFGEGFGDRWFATEQSVHNLLGVGGPGAPSVLKSWEQMLKGTIANANPVVAVAGEVQNALDSPSAAYYLGAKTSDAAVALPGMLFGGEGAAVEAGLGDVGPGVLETGPVVSPQAPIGFDHPPGYNPWAEHAAEDLNYAFGHGGPTPSLSRQLAAMATHYVGDNPDRVVLGKFDGQEGGYIGEARAHGGIYFDTGAPTWDAIVNGLSGSRAEDLAWDVNEQFLRGQMENHVGRIEYTLDREKYSSLEAMMFDRAGSFSAREVEFLSKNAAAYGYERAGDAWVYVGGR